MGAAEVEAAETQGHKQKTGPPFEVDNFSRSDRSEFNNSVEWIAPLILSDSNKNFDTRSGLKKWQTGVKKVFLHCTDIPRPWYVSTAAPSVFWVDTS